MSKQPAALASSRAQTMERAAGALRARQFAEAERLAGEILKASRTDVAAITLLSHALLAQGRHAEAVAPLERALRRGRDAAMETLLGAALGGSGRGGEAIAQLRRTIELKPVYPPAFQELAGQLDTAGHTADAIAVMQNAVAAVPDLVELQLDLARLLMQRNQRDDARVILIKSREAAPGRPDVLIALARCLLLDGDYAASAEAFRHALALRPDDALTRADLAACLLEMGQRETAEAQLRGSMKTNPQLIGRAIYAMAMSSHGRLFMRPSDAAKFLRDK